METTDAMLKTAVYYWSPTLKFANLTFHNLKKIMLHNKSADGDQFTFVSYKRGKRPALRPQLPSSTVNPAQFNEDSVIRRIEEARLEIATSDVFQSIVSSLRESLTHLENPTIKEIVCLGLGKFSELTTARYQLGLLLCLKQQYSVGISIYDPIFSEFEEGILKKFHLNVLTHNQEGKYKVCDNSTIFYLPHCPKQLTNNLLWANWGLNLNYCIIIANSFNTIIERTSKKTLEKFAKLIETIFPYVLEFAVINSFKYYEIFNDTAIHIFPYEKIKLISEDFWLAAKEPQYYQDEIEFIAK